MQFSLTVIIPAYNESKRILKSLNDIDEFIQKGNLASLWNVIVVNDGSIDATEEVVKSWIHSNCKNKSCFQIESYAKNQGKGYAINKGFQLAQNDLVLYTDADGACPIEEVEKLLAWIDKGFDVVCGSRVLKDEYSKVKMTFKRRLIGLGFHSILSILDLASIEDTQCGFKLFKTTAAKKIIEKQRCFNYSFDIEYLFLSNLLGYQIKEVPVNWYHVRGSKVNLYIDSIKMLIEVLKIRFCYKYNVKKQEAGGKKQEERGKKQEARSKK